MKKSKHQESSAGLILSKRKYLQLFILILCVAFFLRIFRLDQPKEYYFDEVYHAFTARVHLHNDPVGYDIWATPPQGVAYEWTHPPFAKLLMAGSMAIFGENSFGWRFSSAVFGTGVIAMTMLLAEKLLKSKHIALLAGAFLTLDGLLLVQSRIAMNDTHFLFFALSSLLTYVTWKEKKEQWKNLLLSGVFLGLALASKWTTLYALGFIGIDLIIQVFKKQLPITIKQVCFLFVSLFVIPVAIYVGSYTQFFSLGYHVNDFIELQKQMWWYHTNLKATHPYQSVPWQWILDLRPVWMWVGQTDADTTANIYNLGNPFFFWSGLASVIAGIFILRKKLNTNLLFIVLWYLCMWLPWIRSPRVMFFYHYLPALPPMAILLATFSANLLGWSSPTSSIQLPVLFKKYGVGIIITLLILCTLWMVLFYPNLIGLPVSKEFADSLYFFIDSWK